ncbi:hypothetical protein T10_2337 [Trichinella papuae]|uniref:Uncharacterized protein n=1 Tax=Trichinella papuae TaxID=268474 RepID=A0A0V1MB18_9BILA|nr:hypothetical protein T10_2337 [Trichinella papuae]
MAIYSMFTTYIGNSIVNSYPNSNTSFSMFYHLYKLFYLQFERKKKNKIPSSIPKPYHLFYSFTKI